MSDASEVLNAITAPDNYSRASTIEGTPIRRVLIDVVNSPIYWQLQKSAGGSGFAGNWEGVETYMIPGSRMITRSGITGVRIRAAIPTASLASGAIQAVVTVEAVK